MQINLSAAAHACTDGWLQIYSGHQCRSARIRPAHQFQSCQRRGVDAQRRACDSSLLEERVSEQSSAAHEGLAHVKRFRWASWTGRLVQLALKVPLEMGPFLPPEASELALLIVPSVFTTPRRLQPVRMADGRSVPQHPPAKLDARGPSIRRRRRSLGFAPPSSAARQRRREARRIAGYPPAW
jgi:hypothetical protein